MFVFHEVLIICICSDDNKYSSEKEKKKTKWSRILKNNELFKREKKLMS